MLFIRFLNDTFCTKISPVFFHPVSHKQDDSRKKGCQTNRTRKPRQHHCLRNFGQIHSFLRNIQLTETAEMLSCLNSPESHLPGFRADQSPRSRRTATHLNHPVTRAWGNSQEPRARPGRRNRPFRLSRAHPLPAAWTRARGSCACAVGLAALPVRPARRGGTDASTHGRKVSPTCAAALAPTYTCSAVSPAEMLRACQLSGVTSTAQVRTRAPGESAW